MAWPDEPPFLIRWPERPQLKARSGMRKAFEPFLTPPEPIAAEKPAKPAGTEKVVIVVAEVHYPRPAEHQMMPAKVPDRFHLISMNYKDYVLKNSIADVVIVFHFLKGQVLEFRNGGPAGGKVLLARQKLEMNDYRWWIDRSNSDGGLLTKTVPTKGSPWERALYWPGVTEFGGLDGSKPKDVKGKDYDAWVAKQPDSKDLGLSIWHVYKTIFDAPASSIKELHFFGHSHAGGPIIVNTWGYASKTFDKDARTGDFTKLKEFFDSTNLPTFQSSFTADATMTIWGCDASLCHKTVVHQARTKPKTAIQRKDVSKECNADLKANLGKENPLLKKILADTYAAAFAATTKRQALAALPGIGAYDDADDKKVTFTPQLMHIKYEEAGALMLYYRDQLGVEFATTGVYAAPSGTDAARERLGRGYAKFK